MEYTEAEILQLMEEILPEWEEWCENIATLEDSEEEEEIDIEAYENYMFILVEMVTERQEDCWRNGEQAD